MSGQTKAYDCRQCPGVCCSVYEKVEVTTRDIKRLARHLKMKAGRLVQTYLQRGGTLLLKRKTDWMFRETCIFFDVQKRCCSVYEARPQVCRDWPMPELRAAGAEDRCAYFDLHQLAQREHGPRAVPIVQIVRVVPDERRKVVGE